MGQYDAMRSTGNANLIGENGNIIEFLERPVQIAAFRITTSSPNIQPVYITKLGAQQSLKGFDFPLMALTEPKKEKLNYFRWFRADVLLRLMINANPFIGGKLLVTIAPYDAFVTPAHSISRKGRRGITSYPCTEIDIQTATATEITIPWMCRKECIDLLDYSDEDWRNVTAHIWLQSPLLAADNQPTTSVSVQVFASLRNIELKMPTPYKCSFAPKAVLQMNYGSKKTASKTEAPGPITKLASTVSTVASHLTKIPLISEIAAPVAWAADIVGGITSIFGWSRPIEGRTMPVTNIPGRAFTSFVAGDAGVVLGANSDNSLAVSNDNTNVDIDEMEIGYICARPGMINSIIWKSSDDFGHFLGSNFVGAHPTDSYYTDDDKRVICDPLLGDYVINGFKLYRADTCFRISLVKTKYHVGRLEVSFLPFESPADDLDTSNAYREIFDISDRDEILFTVPYFSQDVMRWTRNGTSGTYGILAFRVITPLSAPDTVSPNIYINVWKWYENVAVAGPIARDFKVTIEEEPTVLKAVLQVNAEREMTSEKIVFGKMNSPETLMDSCKAVSGEMIVNLRAATRGCRIQDELVDTSVPIKISSDLPGYLGVCASIFRFYRGGINIKAISTNKMPFFSTLVDEDSDTFGAYSNAPSHFTDPTITPIHEISIPYYETCRRMPTNFVVEGRNTVIFTGIGGKPQLTLMYGGKDDLEFNYLVGPPLMSDFA
uniref:Structural polyprotein n=1 Tax=PNG bee virus 2 TaxID=2746874 RepID=A0A7D5CIF2_9VIRU|nr:structural polyprotein [PNG bee virus 2]